MPDATLPPMTPVTSTNIKAVGHDPATFTLYVEFNSGGLFAYENVPAETATRMLSAPSPGGFLHQHVKGRHEHRKVERGEAR